MRLELGEKICRSCDPRTSSRYDQKTGVITIVTDRCPMRHQNLDHSLYALTAAYCESWLTEEWELTERQEADMAEFNFENSRSEKCVFLD